MLQRTEAIVQLAPEIIERAAESNPGDRAFLEAAISSYLAAMAYAETEKTVSTILDGRLRATNDVKLGHFLSETYGKGQGRIAKSDISNLAKKFGSDCKDSFNDIVEDRDVTQYTNLLECRHKLAHGEPRPETLAGIEKGLDAARKLLNAFRQSIV